MFSIVIPLYNKENSITETLNSVLSQSFRDFEVLIINDGSTDHSVDRISLFHDHRIRIIHQENGGPSKARNRGIQEARFDYIAFLDADDLWMSNYLETQNMLIQDFPMAAMYGCSWYNKDADEIKRPNHGKINENYRGIVENYFERKKRLYLFWTSTIVIPVSTFEKIGIFDERIKFGQGEDHDLWFRIVSELPVVFYNLPLAYYKIDSENRMSKLRKPELKYCWPYFLEKYEPLSKKEPDYIQYLHTFFAGFILHYYFGTKIERHDAKFIISHLDFSKIKAKYFLMYRTPFLLGSMFYLLLKVKNKITGFILSLKNA